MADGLAVDPDITVYVTCDDAPSRTFEVLVSTPHPVEYDAAPRRWNLGDEPEVFVARYLEGLEQASAPGVFEARLMGIGQRLFRLAPKAFRDLYWSLVDSGVLPSSILVHTEESLVPWELMVPNRVTPLGLRTTETPLGFQAAVGRWLTTGGQAPEQATTLRNGRVFTPKYRGRSKLRHARTESEVVRRATGAVEVRLDSHRALREAIAKDVSLLHLICHGRINSARCHILILEDEIELWPEDVAGMDDLREAFHIARPVVFLNACEVGRGSPSVVGPGGFAAEFIDLGASCVIAPLWSVRDDVAGRVAAEFYRRAAAAPSVSFAEVLRDIRCVAFSEDQDSFAAYAFYGDPLMRGQIEPAS